MLTPYAVDIHSWNLSNYLTMFHICQTIWQHFFSSSSQVVHWSAEIQKQNFTTQGRKEGTKEWPTNRPNKWICTRSSEAQVKLHSYFAFYKIVVKSKQVSNFCYLCHTLGAVTWHHHWQLRYLWVLSYHWLWLLMCSWRE